MANPTLELYMLQESLRAQIASRIKGHVADMLSLSDYSRLARIMQQAEHELNIMILDIVVSNLQEVQQLAIEYGIRDFAENVQIEVVGGSFRIGVAGGRTDFSTEPVEMLPMLLRGGKTSKTGSTYKVIPVPTTPPKKRFILNSADAAAARAEEIKSGWDKRNSDLDAGNMAQQFANSMPKVSLKEEKITPGQGVNFRTASSTQSASTRWVKPAKQIDLTREISNINMRMDSQIANATSIIISRFRQTI